MKGLARLSLVGMLFLGSSCAARPDWIQSTLVTTDVTVFRFAITFRDLTGEVPVAGDEMTGEVFVPQVGGGGAGKQAQTGLASR